MSTFLLGDFLKFQNSVWDVWKDEKVEERMSPESRRSLAGMHMHRDSGRREQGTPASCLNLKSSLSNLEQGLEVV